MRATQMLAGTIVPYSNASATLWLDNAEGVPFDELCRQCWQVFSFTLSRVFLQFSS
jgi:hypothetical protein